MSQVKMSRCEKIIWGLAQETILKYVVSGAKGRNAFVFDYIYIYMYIYSNSIVNLGEAQWIYIL